ncbi:MAG: redoxin domain-containing protein [Ignavibacteriales bacterium]|nr:redoxin domain-containing protein [Ignavibacteriales bacterium]
MKKIVSIVALFLLLGFNSSIHSQSNENFSFSPAKPKAGEKITITYNPAGTKIENAENISMLVHAYGKNIYSTNEYDLKKEGKVWKGSFSAADTCAGVVLRFTDGKEYDNNGSKCFPVRFYGADGKFVKYASGGLAVGYINWFGAFNLDSDPETAFKYFNEELSLYPSSKKDFFFMYNSAYSKVDKEKAAEYLKTEAGNFEKTLSQNEEDLSFLSQLYRVLKAKDKYEATQALILQKYPTGSSAEMIKFNEAYGTKDAAKKAELADKFKAQFPKSQYVVYLFPDPSQALIKEGKYEEAFDAIKKNEKSTSSDYNNLAWAMFEKNVNLPLAKEVAAKGVELSGKVVQKTDVKTPPYYSEKEYKKIMSASAYAVIDTYGAILLKLGDNKEALQVMKKAYDLDGGKSADINERYSQALVANGKYAEATTEMEKFITDGKSTSTMKDLLKEAYTKTKGSDAGFEKYLSGMELKANKSALDEMKKTMIEMPAPKFTLVDLDGKNVSLADLKGKIVIIDFWATWCGPCKASFPGMQKAVNKFGSDPNVKFLFVNTWENNVDDKKKNAQDFITQNKYTFHVLLDNDNKVIESYKVDGIPTKFIIDKTGNIRFKAVGFSGSDDKLVTELSTMISLLQ